MRKHSRFLVNTVLAAAAFVGLLSCTTIDEPILGLGALEIVSGDNQDLIVGQPAPLPLIVRTLDQDAKPAMGVTVNWTVVSGGGSVSSPSSVTDVNGTASVNYTAADSTGTVFVRARAEDLSLTFTLNVKTAPVMGKALRLEPSL